MSFRVQLKERLVELAAKLDLGRQPETSCIGYGPKESRPRTWYPGLYIDGIKEPIDLPLTGKAIIDYKLTRKSTTIVNDEERHDASLDVISIEPMDAAKKQPKALPGSAKLVKTGLELSAKSTGNRLRPRMIELATPGFRFPWEPKAPGQPSPAHDIVTGGIEGGAGVVATDALIDNLLHGTGSLRSRLAATGAGIAGNFKTGNRLSLLKKLGIGASVGAAATGLIGAGVSATARKTKRDQELSRLCPGMIEARQIGNPNIIGIARREITFDSRARNNDGEFVAAETGGADPNSMAAAYGPAAIAQNTRRSALSGALNGAASGVGIGVGSSLITPGIRKVINAGARRLRTLAASTAA